MNYDKQQKPSTVNQIESEKPTVPKSIDNILTGYIANSMNGGHNRTIFYKKIMAGEKHKETNIRMNIQMLTPLTPTYQNLKCTLRTYFVPNIRVWNNAEKYTAQKGGTTATKISQIPNIGGKSMPQCEDTVLQDNWTLITNTQQWRDSWIASYIPRMYHQTDEVGEPDNQMPYISVIPLRGRIAIYNDFERNKQFDQEIQEYKGDQVSDQEWESYLPTSGKNLDIIQMRAKKENSYYTDYRTDLSGFDESAPEYNEDNFLLNWAAYESKIAESRAQSENAEKNDWEIIAEIRGSKKLSEGKVQLIGQRTFNLNYSAITQNTYNNSEDVQDETFRIMGKQGAYSYTEIEVPLYAGIEFIEEGYIHVIATVTADTVYEQAINRMEINITPLDEYRPDLLDDKKDVLYKMEFGANEMDSLTDIVGFKRKYSEYFKLNNVIAGDMTTYPYFNYNRNQFDVYQPKNFNSDERTLTNDTYQFFEVYAEESVFYQNEYGSINKNIWLDYTDLMINKNQAIRNEIIPLRTMQGSIQNYKNFVLGGQNQIFFVGMVTCIADLPIDNSIKSNYTQWGEH